MEFTSNQWIKNTNFWFEPRNGLYEKEEVNLLNSIQKLTNEKDSLSNQNVELKYENNSLLFQKEETINNQLSFSEDYDISDEIDNNISEDIEEEVLATQEDTYSILEDNEIAEKTLLEMAEDGTVLEIAKEWGLEDQLCIGK